MQCNMALNKTMKYSFTVLYVLTLILLGLTISLNVLLITKCDCDEAKQGSRLQNAVGEGIGYLLFFPLLCPSIGGVSKPFSLLPEPNIEY